MGRPPKIRSLHIADVKVHSPKALHLSAVAKTSVKIPARSNYSYRFGVKSTSNQSIIPGIFRAPPTQSIAKQAKLFGKTKDMIFTSSHTKPLLGLAGAAGALTLILNNYGIPSVLTNDVGSYGKFLGIVFLPVLGMAVGNGKKPIQLSSPSDTLPEAVNPLEATKPENQAWVTETIQVPRTSEEIPKKVQEQIDTIVDLSDRDGYEYGFVTVQVGKKILRWQIKGEKQYITSHDEREIGGGLYHQNVIYLLNKMKFLMADLRGQPVKIYFFHTHPKRDRPENALVQSPIYTHKDGKVYTHINSPDCSCADQLLGFFGPFLREFNYTGSIEMLAAAVPARTGVSKEDLYLATYNRRVNPGEETPIPDSATSFNIHHYLFGGKKGPETEKFETIIEKLSSSQSLSEKEKRDLAELFPEGMDLFPDGQNKKSFNESSGKLLKALRSNKPLYIMDISVSDILSRIKLLTGLTQTPLYVFNAADDTSLRNVLVDSLENKGQEGIGTEKVLSFEKITKILKSGGWVVIDRVGALNAKDYEALQVLAEGMEQGEIRILQEDLGKGNTKITEGGKIHPKARLIVIDYKGPNPYYSNSNHLFGEFSFVDVFSDFIDIINRPNLSEFLYANFNRITMEDLEFVVPEWHNKLQEARFPKKDQGHWVKEEEFLKFLGFGENEPSLEERLFVKTYLTYLEVMMPTGTFMPAVDFLKFLISQKPRKINSHKNFSLFPKKGDEE